MNRIKKFFNTFLLFELLKGMAVTGKYLFKPKITIHYPEEKNTAIASLSRLARITTLSER